MNTTIEALDPNYPSPYPLFSMRPAATIFFTLALSACSSASPDAQAIVDGALEAAGASNIDGSVITFDFRGKHFTVTHDGGRYRYERDYTDSTGTVHEVLSNDQLYREINGHSTQLSAEADDIMEEDINSVVYFALLPYRLNDRAVQKRALGTSVVHGQLYDMIEVTFRQDGGGKDYQDRFVYWFHHERCTMDFLAYYYHSGEMGSRFRQAIHPRTVGGIRFADYLNFDADTLGLNDIEHYGSLFDAGALETVSIVTLDHIKVQARKP